MCAAVPMPEVNSGARPNRSATIFMLSTYVGAKDSQGIPDPCVISRLNTASKSSW